MERSDRKRRIIYLFVVLLSLMILLNGSSVVIKGDSDLSGKAVFNAGYPKILSFRGLENLASDYKYSKWENMHIRFQTISKKYMTEELNLSTISMDHANRFAVDHPEKLMLFHFNGECRSIKDKEIHDLYFPGHWVYESGTRLTEDITADQKVLKVQTANIFSETAYKFHDGSDNSLPHDLLIVETDQNGNRLWFNSEYAKIENVDAVNNTITVKRGQYFSTPKSFSSTSAYLAPLAGDIWGTPEMLMWFYNLSSECPRDSNNLQSSDVLVGQIKSWFADNGPLRNIDGIGGDVNYFVQSNRGKWDCNNDGIRDGGIVNKVNIYRLGDWDFLKKLRAAMGPEFLLTSDGWLDRHQRAVGILNGMETEGHCRYDDAFRQISRTINQHTYWNMHNNARYKFSYVTSKIENTVDAARTVEFHRMMLGVTSCLGISYAYGPPWIISEARGGELNQGSWMGQPAGEIRYPAKQTTDYLNGLGLTMSSQLLSQFDFSNVNYRVENNTLIISGKQTDPYANISIPGPSVVIPQGGDLVVFFEAKAIKGYHDFLTEDRVPRKINIKVDATPSYTLPGETAAMIALHNDLAGFMGTPGFTPLNFYFRKVGRPGTPIRLTFEVEEQGEFAIRNLTVHSAPLTMAREFEKGVVVVNTSYDDQVVNLRSLFPGSYSFTRLKAIPAEPGFTLDGDFSSIYSYNNGSKITNPQSVTIPFLNALFLIKEYDPSAVEDNPEDSRLILYPNPGTGGFLWMTVPEEIGKSTTTIRVIDLNNRTLIHRSYSTTEEMCLDISSLKPGLYLVHLSAGTLTITKRLIKL